MDVLGALLARSRRGELGDALALRHAPTGRHYDYHRFCTTAWKVGNLLRNEGVRGGATVVVAPVPSPEALLTLAGTALLGATVRLDPTDASGAKALVAPTDRLDDYDPGPGTRLVGYGDDPSDPAVARFERDVWSENPTEPPDEVVPDDALLAAGGRTYAHREVLDAARTVADGWSLTDDDAVAVRSSLTHPGTVAAGVVAPLLVGGTVLVPGDGTTGAFAVADGDTSEPSVAPGDVLG